MSRSTAGGRALEAGDHDDVAFASEVLRHFLGDALPHRDVALPDEQRLVGRHVAIHDDERNAGGHHGPGRRHEGGRFDRAQQHGIDAAREQVTNVVALLGDIDVAVEHDDLDVRMTAGLGLQGRQHRNPPRMVEPRLRETNRQVARLAGDADWAVGKRQVRLNGRAL